MKNVIIKVNNTSSPGASFTNNTNKVMILIYEWIKEHNNETMSFVDFRHKIEIDKGVNDNNNRNIFPLLKNCGMVNYIEKKDINVNSFFTNSGLAYIKLLESLQMIENNDEMDNIMKEEVRVKIGAMLYDCIYLAIEKLLSVKDTNYYNPLCEFIIFLIKFKSIDRLEFAYYLSKRPDTFDEKIFDIINDDINKYRNGKLNFKVAVEVRNDKRIVEESNKSKRTEGATFLTSFTYFSSLLEQANLIYKDSSKTHSTRYNIVSNRYDKLINLGGNYGEY